MGEGKTMIRISKEAREGLKAIGKKGDTYDEIIKRLLEGAKRDDS